MRKLETDVICRVSKAPLTHDHRKTWEVLSISRIRVCCMPVSGSTALILEVDRAQYCSHWDERLYILETTKAAHSYS